jgi:hypothetical protein
MAKYWAKIFSLSQKRSSGVNFAHSCHSSGQSSNFIAVPNISRTDDLSSGKPSFAKPSANKKMVTLFFPSQSSVWR